MAGSTRPARNCPLDPPCSAQERCAARHQGTCSENTPGHGCGGKNGRCRERHTAAAEPHPLGSTADFRPRRAYCYILVSAHSCQGTRTPHMPRPAPLRRALPIWSIFISSVAALLVPRHRIFFRNSFLAVLRVVTALRAACQCIPHWDTVPARTSLGCVPVLHSLHACTAFRSLPVGRPRVRSSR